LDVTTQDENSLSSDERTRHIAEEYDEYADIFARWRPSSQFREIFEKTVLELVERHSDLSQKVRVLDVGCGHGTWIKYTLERTRNFTNLHIKGIDISRQRIRLAKSILANYPNVSLEVEDAKQYCTPERYDIVFFAEVFALFPKTYYPTILCKYFDQLAEKGHLVVIDKEKYSFHCLKVYMKRKFGLFNRTWDFIYYPSFRHLSRIAQEIGFKIVGRLRVKEFRGLVSLKPSASKCSIDRKGV